MQKLVDELKTMLDFKDTTNVGDVVLIAAKEPQMLIYAYVSRIERDTSRRDEWWHVDLDMLSIPLQKMTWTLRWEQMTGREIFTMGGEGRFVKALEFGGRKNTTEKETKKKTKSKTKNSKITPLKRVK